MVPRKDNVENPQVILLKTINREMNILFKEGILNIVKGKMGSGKTNFGVLLAEMFLGLNLGVVLTNIKYTFSKEWNPFLQKIDTLINEKDRKFYFKNNIKNVFSLYDYFKVVCELPNDLLIFLLLDEAGLWANKQGASGSKKIKSLEQFVMLMRKTGYCFTLIEQSDRGISNFLTEDFWYAKIEKEFTNKKKCKIVFSEKEGVIPWGDIPIPMFLQYDTKQMASFDVNLDMEKMINEIKDLWSYEVKPHILTVLDNCILSPDTDKELSISEKRAIRVEDIILKGGGWKEIMKELKLGQETAKKWAKRIKLELNLDG